jgi:hypothetical protein
MLSTVGFEADQVTPNGNASTAHIKPQAHEIMIRNFEKE